MTRYLRLYAYFLQFSFSRAMEFRLDFFFRVFMDALFYAVQIGFFSVLYRHTSLLGGWSEERALVFVTAYLFIDSAHMTIFINNVWPLPRMINRGELDYYLTRPVSSLFFLSFRDFAANSFLNLLLAIGLVTWAIGRLAEPPTLGRIFLFATLLAAGLLLYYAIQMLFFIAAFWTQSSEGFVEFWRAAEKYSERPHTIYPDWLQRIFLTVLPLALVASEPARILFEGASGRELLQFGGVFVGMFALLGWLWGRGLRAYGSASS
jgi:ABC-2 type transport system permease protein